MYDSYIISIITLVIVSTYSTVLLMCVLMSRDLTDIVKG